jgi:hypothetical protein
VHEELRFANLNSSCKGCETGEPILQHLKLDRDEFDPASSLFATKVENNAIAAANCREFRSCPCTAATLVQRLKMNLTFACGHRL